MTARELERYVKIVQPVLDVIAGVLYFRAARRAYGRGHRKRTLLWAFQAGTMNGSLAGGDHISKAFKALREA